MSAQRIILASDSFKGTLSSAEIAEMLSASIYRYLPGFECVSLPMADGGEGTLAALVSALDAEEHVLVVHDPLGRPVSATYGIITSAAGKRSALIEMAAASGLPLLKTSERNPLISSTFGCGELIRDALDQNCTELVLALGGSATNDGGIGCMKALGARFFDVQGNELQACGKDLEKLARIDLSNFDARLKDLHVRVLCDVDNPLIGPCGATATFGPQKGADVVSLERLERGMQHYAQILEQQFNKNFNISGAGAAGGFGAGALAFLNAELVGGIQTVLDLLHFDELIANAALCITGEGHLDEQTAHGKVVTGVAAACARHHVPCVAVVGGASLAAREIPGLSVVVPTTLAPMPLDYALKHAHELYKLAADRLCILLALGMDMNRQ